MALYLGTLIFAFIFSCIAILPYIDFLYSRKNRPHFTPSHGGLLVILVIALLYFFLYPLFQKFGVHIFTSFPITQEINLIFLTIFSFSGLGLVCDLFKINSKYRWIMTTGLSVIVSAMLIYNLNVRVLNFPALAVVYLGWWILPISSAIILLFIKSIWIADEIDGLANGLLLICLLVFWAISVANLDTPLSIFMALWIGSLLALLYFNVFPARITTGSAGKLGFAATLAVIGLMLGKIIALIMVGGVLIANTLPTLVSHPPIQAKLIKWGWPKPKIMMRSWLVGIVVAVLGLWLALL